MSVRLVKEYEVAMIHTYTIDISQEEYDQFILDNPAPDGVDYEDMFDYFESRGHNVDIEEDTVDYQNNGVEVEFL